MRAAVIIAIVISLAGCMSREESIASSAAKWERCKSGEFLNDVGYETCRTLAIIKIAESFERREAEL